MTLKYSWVSTFQSSSPSAIQDTNLQCSSETSFVASHNPLTPMSDQDRISPYNINQISDENKEKYQFGDNELIQH